MAAGMYEVLVLLPESSDFTLDAAVLHFNDIRHGKDERRATLATPEGQSEPSGFRVYYGDWAVVAWLECGKTVLSESQNLAGSDDLPAPAEVIASCSRRLSVWSDEDWDGDHSDDFTDFTDELRKRFGGFIFDNVNGGWWT